MENVQTRIVKLNCTGCRAVGSSKNQGEGAVKFGYSEKATKFEKIFHLKFDVTE